MKKQTCILKLPIETNLHPREAITIDNWKFEKQNIKNQEILVGQFEFEEKEDTTLNLMLGKEVLTKIRDSIELPLIVLSFCLDGIFRAHPQRMYVSFPKEKKTQEIVLEDFRHPTIGRIFSLQECVNVEKLITALKKDKFMVKVFEYYNEGLFLARGFYHLAVAFLNFYKVIEMISWEICKPFNHELKLNKQNELDAIASRIMNERILDDSKHTRQTKINRIKNLIKKYAQQKEISAIDQISFACVKLNLNQNEETIKSLVKIRNKEGIAHSSVESGKWYKELRLCRDLARKFILEYLISKDVISQENLKELIDAPSGVYISKD